ncbi:hypothetical protein L1887_59563 [Cichorium endivia]|nr:hypothetical protein L1887_59563 [Cichorium endivia]
MRWTLRCCSQPPPSIHRSALHPSRRLSRPSRTTSHAASRLDPRSQAQAAKSTSCSSSLSIAPSIHPASCTLVKMEDALSLQKSKAQWLAALDDAIDTFRTLVAESSSKAWKPVSLGGSTPATPNLASTSSFPMTPSQSAASSGASKSAAASRSKKRDSSSLRHVESIEDFDSHIDSPSSAAAASTASPPPQKPSASDPQPFRIGRFRPDQVAVHRRTRKGPDIYRAVSEVAYDGTADLRAFRSLLQTAETRASWDRLVQSAELVEQLDPITRINKVHYRLGWPASPRDAIVINRTLADDATLIDISTSLPRSPDAPSYLRPAPPCVRSHVHLMAWCIQILPPESSSSSSSSTTRSKSTSSSAPLRSLPRIKLSVFWSWDLRGAWMGMPSGGLGMHLPELIKALAFHVQDHSDKIPALTNYGSCVEVLTSLFDPTRDTLVTEYAVVEEDVAARQAEDRAEKDLDTVHLLRSRRKLQATVEFLLPSTEGWDVRVQVKGQTSPSTADADASAEDGPSPWRATAERASGSRFTLLSIRHKTLDSPEQLARITVRIQRVAASTELRLNDAPLNVEHVEPRTAAALAQPLLEDTASISEISVATTSTGSAASFNVGTAANASRSGTPNLGSAHQINNQIRRNYIYFTSLLQEPEAKWKSISDMKGVTVTQLDSIDPTLVVYRAEATFVGVSVWDLFSTIGNAGARAYWDKALDDAVLLTDINELSSLWHTKTKPSWPVSARDTVVIQTAYKSPTSVHIFSFSTDDRAQLPAIPPVESGTIRTQIDLRGWSVEALSPTTVHVTMLEQSDPKGWTSKSATPAAMVSAVAGVGEYAIKFGSPPVLTRLLGAKAKVSRYDHEKATFRVEYACDVPLDDDLNDAPNVECEIRCDVETWATSLDLVVDPPPISISCLRRHKLSQGGGGLWLTVEHAVASLEDDSARIIIRRGTSRDKGAVHVNGASIKVDVDELNDEQVQQLSRQKRSKPQRVPLDLINPARKPIEDAATVTTKTGGTESSAAGSVESSKEQGARQSAENGNDERHLSDGTSTSAAAGVGAGAATEAKKRERGDSTGQPAAAVPFSDETPRQPMTCALDVLFLLRRIHAERSPDPAGTPAGWALVTERNGLYVRRKLMESISSTVLVQRGDKVVQGLSAEDLLDVVANLRSRKQWDDKIESTTLLESYGDGSFTSFITTKASFPFRGRAFHLASLTARGAPPSSNGATSPGEAPLSSSAASWSGPAVYFHASASFPQQNFGFAPDRLNPNGLPFGKVLIDGWILETLDPYSSTSFQIPSTRCTHVVAVDYAGSLPVAVNTMWNANLPRSVLLVEDYLKARGSIPSVKTPPACLQVLGDGRDEDQGFVWSLKDPQRKNLLVSSSFDPTTRMYVAVSMHRPSPASAAEEVPGLLPAASIVSNGKPRPRSSDASVTKGVAEKLTQAINAAPGTPLLGSAAPPVNSSADQDSSLSRATSMHSITSASAASTASTIRRRPSSIHTDSRNAKDLILMEVEIELRHYHKGYDVQCFSEFAPLDASVSDSATAALPKQDRSAAGGETAASEHDKAPATASRGAETGKPKPPFSLRMAPEKSNDLPTPLTGSKPPDTPAWYTSLLERGAVLRLVVKPLKSEGAEADPAGAPRDANGTLVFATPSGKVAVRSGDVKLDIVHVNQTSAMLQREQIGIEPMTQLKRVAPARPRSARKSGLEGAAATKDDGRLPEALRRPVAQRTDLLQAPAAAQADAGKDDAKGAKASAAGGADKAARPAAGAEKSGKAGSLAPSSAAGSANGSAAGALASSLTSVSSVTARGSSVASSSSAKTNAEALAASDRAKHPRSADKGDKATTAPDAVSAAQDERGSAGEVVVEAAASAGSTLAQAAKDAVSALGGVWRSETQFRLSTLVLVAVAAFLVGSLMRSMLAPLDFVLAPTGVPQPAADGDFTQLVRSLRAGEAGNKIDRLVEQLGSAKGEGRVTQMQWTQLRRLVHVPVPALGWDIVLAGVRRRG